ncbi:MAG TPA: 2'-5' RNA ligase family protein, partial [Candidatus Thermoplasmatota archaeon]|nr:2'-5' RNA ligase family protein [Candidatus Thermoplasmatota archaeon]
MRLFIGLPLPPHPAYGEVTHDLVNSAPGVRPVPEGSWHVTLRFLGEVADAAPVEAALAGTCSGLAALPAAVTGVGGV